MRDLEVLEIVPPEPGRTLQDLMAVVGASAALPVVEAVACGKMSLPWSYRDLFAESGAVPVPFQDSRGVSSAELRRSRGERCLSR